MITVTVAGFLTNFTGGERHVTIDSTPRTVEEALAALWKRHAGLRDRIVNERGQVRPHVNVFVNTENIKHKQALDTALADGDEVTVLPAISGG